MGLGILPPTNCPFLAAIHRSTITNPLSHHSPTHPPPQESNLHVHIILVFPIQTITKWARGKTFFRDFNLIFPFPPVNRGRARRPSSCSATGADASFKFWGLVMLGIGIGGYCLVLFGPWIASLEGGKGQQQPDGNHAQQHVLMKLQPPTSTFLEKWN